MPHNNDVTPWRERANNREIEGKSSGFQEQYCSHAVRQQHRRDFDSSESAIR
jgi:hypothetical protein